MFGATTATESVRLLAERDEAFPVKDYELELALPAAASLLVPRFQEVAQSDDAEAALDLARDIAEAARLLAELREARAERCREKYGECEGCQRPFTDSYNRHAPYCGDLCRERAKERKRANHAAERLARQREEALARLPYRVASMERREMASILAKARVEHRLATRKFTPYNGPARVCYVYRLFDAEENLLYVGKTYSMKVRLFSGETSHAKTKPWFSRVASVQVTAYKSDADALEAEAWAIRREAPLYNKAQPKTRQPRAPRKIASYSGAI